MEKNNERKRRQNGEKIGIERDRKEKKKIGTSKKTETSKVKERKGKNEANAQCLRKKYYKEC